MKKIIIILSLIIVITLVSIAGPVEPNNETASNSHKVVNFSV